VIDDPKEGSRDPTTPPGEVGDVFLPITYRPGGFGEEAAKMRSYERGCIMRTSSAGTTLHPAIRHPDGRVEEVVQVEETPSPGASLPELARWLVEWCAEHGQIESAFLYPNPAHYVFTFSLFDDLCKKLGVTKEVIGDLFAEAQERRAAAKEKA